LGGRLLGRLGRLLGRLLRGLRGLLRSHRESSCMRPGKISARCRLHRLIAAFSPAEATDVARRILPRMVTVKEILASPKPLYPVSSRQSAPQALRGVYAGSAHNAIATTGLRSN